MPRGIRKVIAEQKQQVIAELGNRYNEKKLPMALASVYAKRGMVRVLAWAAARKYGPWNWSKGLDIAETTESLERHLDDLRCGKFYDDESGLPIIDHIQCNAMFLSHFFHTGQWSELDSKMPYQYVLFDDVVAAGDEV